MVNKYNYCNYCPDVDSCKNAGQCLSLTPEDYDEYLDARGDSVYYDEDDWSKT